MKLKDPVELILKGKGRTVHSVTADATVFEALVLMAKQEIGALAVVEGSKLVGLFSERDYARKVILVGRASKDVKIREIMTSPVITVELSSTVDECMQHMTAKRCRHMPVMGDGHLVGMVSIGDLVHWIIDKQDQRIDHLEHYISGEYPG